MWPERIGKLAVLAELGTGAGSRVLRVRRERDGREYALKAVPLTGRAGRKYVEQARQEYRVARLLDHPNLVKVHAIETERDWLFRAKVVNLLVEFAPGRPMDRVAPPLAELVYVFEQLASALAHMHARGVCHADLKPGNVVLGPHSRVKVIDYGLAWVRGEPKNRARGTPEYMAPETRERAFIDERSDMFNLGATMYRLVTRRFVPVPTPGLSRGEAEYRRSLVPVADLCPAAPAGLCELIHACVE